MMALRADAGTPPSRLCMARVLDIRPENTVDTGYFPGTGSLPAPTTIGD
jgi:hypothetical protein